MARFLWVCLGGAAGTGARYLLGLAAVRGLGAAFPYATLLVNVLGSALLGALVVSARAALLSQTLYLALSTGVMGGFTTYSTFNAETLRFFEQGAWRLGLLNVAVTILGCLCAGLLGGAVARWALSAG